MWAAAMSRNPGATSRSTAWSWIDMSHSRLPFYLIVTILVVAGLTLAWLRHDTMEIPFLPGEQRPVWLVEARVDFVARGSEVRVNLDLPDAPPGFRIVTENAASPGYG